jgi:hypothetical protein
MKTDCVIQKTQNNDEKCCIVVCVLRLCAKTYILTDPKVKSVRSLYTPGRIGSEAPLTEFNAKEVIYDE